MLAPWTLLSGELWYPIWYTQLRQWLVYFSRHYICYTGITHDSSRCINKQRHSHKSCKICINPCITRSSVSYSQLVSKHCQWTIPHDVVMTWTHILHYWPFVRRTYQLIPSTKGQLCCYPGLPLDQTVERSDCDGALRECITQIFGYMYLT